MIAGMMFSMDDLNFSLIQMSNICYLRSAFRCRYCVRPKGGVGAGATVGALPNVQGGRFMTYRFKLSRRMALARGPGLALAGLLLTTACNNDLQDYSNLS